jgi:ATP-dependent Clp protease ATP-binding subunit ClpB
MLHSSCARQGAIAWFAAGSLCGMNSSPLSAARLERLRLLQTRLKEEILGQDHVLPPVVSVLHRGELGLTTPGRPRGSFLFLGPTGVGKTELALSFTRYLFGEERMFRFDMSEYQTQESLGILLGGRLGEEGLLGRPLQTGNEGTLLFDEIEKAHPRVLDILLQIVDAARITMASGRTLDFSGFYIVLTSNLGSAEILTPQHSSFTTIERHVLARAQQALRPESYGRITEKIVFNRLEYNVQLAIASLLMERELERLRGRGFRIIADPEVLPFLVRHGYHPRLGARPMRDAVEKYLRDACVDVILASLQFSNGVLRVAGERLILDGAVPDVA